MADVSESWERFKQFYQNQLNEVTTQFKPDLYWFDVDWEHSAEEWESQKVRAGILEKQSCGYYQWPFEWLPDQLIVELTDDHCMQ